MVAQDLRALVADSNPDSRKQTLHALAAAGFECDAAADGQQAIQRLETAAYDLLVTDVVLDKVNGHAVILQVQRQSDPPRIVVLSSLCDPRLVRDLLARGVDDFLHKSVPADLLTTKLRSLFELSAWRAGQSAAQHAPPGAARSSVLMDVEQRLQQLTWHFADAVAPLFEDEYFLPDLPPALLDFVKRLAAEERAESMAGLGEMADIRSSERVELFTTATAILIDDHHYRASDDPTKVAIRDISATGVKLMHTRAIASSRMVLAWNAETLPFVTLRVPLRITRCRPAGRFYDIGGQFETPDSTLSSAAEVSDHRSHVTN